MSRIERNTSVIALGANVAGNWGNPLETLQTCLNRLGSQGFKDIQVSPFYRTKAVGSIRQPDYLNCVIQAECANSPRQIIEIFKQNERCAGRRLLGRNAPRPLDIDLLDLGGRIINWSAGHPRPKVVLPHPLIADRAFVLAPLGDLIPTWRHPVYQLTAHQLLSRQGGLLRVMLRRELLRIDLTANMCDT